MQASPALPQAFSTAPNLFQLATLLGLGPLATRNSLATPQTQLYPQLWQNNPLDLLTGPIMTIPVSLLQNLVDHMNQLSTFSPHEYRQVTDGLLRLVGVITLQQNSSSNLNILPSAVAAHASTGHSASTSPQPSANVFVPAGNSQPRYSHPRAVSSHRDSQSDAEDSPVASTSTSRNSRVPFPIKRESMMSRCSVLN